MFLVPRAFIWYLSWVMTVHDLENMNNNWQSLTAPNLQAEKSIYEPTCYLLSALDVSGKHWDVMWQNTQDNAQKQQHAEKKWQHNMGLLSCTRHTTVICWCIMYHWNVILDLHADHNANQIILLPRVGSPDLRAHSLFGAQLLVFVMQLLFCPIIHNLMHSYCIYAIWRGILQVDIN